METAVMQAILPAKTFFLMAAIAVLVSFICAWIDLKTAKIPNKITFPAAAAAILLHTIFGALNGGAMIAIKAAAYSIGGWLVGALVMIGLDLISPQKGRKIGYGDKKLMAAIGAFIGPMYVLIVIFYFCLLYGAASLVKFILAFPWSSVTGMVKDASSGLTPALDKEAANKLNTTMKSRIPIGWAIAGGTIVAATIGRQTLHFFLGCS